MTSVKSAISTNNEPKVDVLPWALDHDSLGGFPREYSGKLTVEDVVKAYGSHKISGVMLVPYFESLVRFAAKVNPINWRTLSAVGSHEMKTLLEIYRSRVILRLKDFVEAKKIDAVLSDEIIAR